MFSVGAATPNSSMIGLVAVGQNQVLFCFQSFCDSGS